MNTRHNNQFRSGAALLVVLFIVMAITLISLGFVARSDRELACGANVNTRMQMDYLAQAGLTHAKNFIINPQSVDTETAGYWQGDTGLQIEENDDYYDISITRDTSDPDDHCDYTIVSQAYRLDSAKKISKSELTAKLRLDPCIALWVANSYSVEHQITINGDVYCDGDLGNYSLNYLAISGDAFAKNDIAISADDIGGAVYPLNSYGKTPAIFPNLTRSSLSPQYKIGTVTYTAEEINTDTLQGDELKLTANNPAGIYYRVGSLELLGDVTIEGTLIVKDDLTVSGTGNSIIAEKNYPAAIIDGKLLLKEQGRLYVEGFVQIDNKIDVESNCSNARLQVVGATFIKSGNIDILGGDFTDVTLEFTAAPELTALDYKSSDNSEVRWNFVGDSFYKTISR